MSRKKIDITKVSDDELIDMFEPVYEEKIASINNISSYECSCKRDTSTGDVRVEVMIVGMAGSPTMDDYKDGNVEDSSSVVIEVEDKGYIKLNFVPKEITPLNTNDYVVVYKLV
jgi:hypothetical protein